MAISFLFAVLWFLPFYIFHRNFFFHTLSCFTGRRFISNSVSNQDGAKISKSLTKSIQRFYMPSKSVMKFHIMKLKCFVESKKITIFLMNLNRNCNTLRWKMKIIFRTSKRRLKDVLFYWDERTNFERTKDVHFRSRADWESLVQK